MNFINAHGGVHMSIDEFRLSKLFENGLLWSAGPELLRFLREATHEDQQTTQQKIVDITLIGWLKGELSHDEAEAKLAALWGAARARRPFQTFAASKSLNGLVDPPGECVRGARAEENILNGTPCRARPMLAEGILDPEPG